MSRLASSVFNGTPRDDLAAVDVYESVSDDIRTEFTSTFSAFGQDLSDAIGLSQGNLKNIGSHIRSTINTLSEGKERLDRVLRSSRATLLDAGSDLRDGLYADMGLDPNAINDTQLLIENTYHKIKNGDIGDAKAISALLTDITGNEVFQAVDIGVDVAVLSEALTKLNEWGVYDIVDDVVGQFDNPEVVRRAARKSVQKTITSGGGVQNISALLNHVNAATLTAGNPDLPRQLLQSYRFDDGVTPGDYPRLLNELVTVMDQVKWDWLETQRGDVAVWNLGLLYNASDDARQLLLSAEDQRYHVPVLTASHFPEQSVTAVLKHHYPRIALA